MRSTEPRTTTGLRHHGSARIRAAVGAGAAAIGIATCAGWAGPNAAAVPTYELRVAPVSWSAPTEERTPAPTADDLEQAAQRAERAADEAEKAAAKAEEEAEAAGRTANTWRLGYDNVLRLYHAKATELARAEKAKEEAWTTYQEAYARYQAQPWYERLWPGDLEYKIWQRARDAWYQQVYRVVSLRAQAEEASERVQRVHQEYLEARDAWTKAQLDASRARSAAETARHDAQEARKEAERARERADQTRQDAEANRPVERDTQPPGPEQPDEGEAGPTGDDDTSDEAIAPARELPAGSDPGPAAP